MGKRLDTRLSEQDRQALEQVVRKSPDWRARERAKTLLLLCQPLLSREVAKVQDLNICTVRETWQRWLQEGMACLHDKPRSGTLRKLDQAAVDRLVQWAREEPLTATELLQRHADAQGEPIHVETLTRILKENGLVWKRTRYSLKKKRDAAACAKSSQELDKLRARAQAGEIVLAYLDEAGFAQVHPNRSAWTPRAEQHRIEAPRGKRLNVMAALLSSGTVEHAHYWCSSTAELFLGFVADLARKVSKPLVIVLDNAKIHNAKAIQPAMALLRQQSVQFEFLSPYSPELNRIETLWRLMKHRWMEVKRRTKEELERAVEHVFEHFGSQFRTEF